MDKGRFAKLTERKLGFGVFLIIAVVMIGIGITSGSLLSSGSSSGELIAEYRVDTGAGDTAKDSAGNNDGTIDGASWTKGVSDKALSFDGSNDQVLGPSSFEPYTSNSDKWTMSVWFKINDLASTEGHDMTIVDNNNRYHMQLNDGDDGMKSIPGGNSFSWNWKPAKGRWHHAALVYDGDGTVRAYANGELEREVSGISPYESSMVGGRFAFGSHTGSRYFDGIIDNVKVYSKDLDESQIKSLYNSGSWRAGSITEDINPSKVLGTSFQHQNSSHVFDTSSSQNHGEPRNDASQETAGGCKVGRCYSFDESGGGGNGQFIEINPASDLSSKEITAMAWIKPKPSTDSRAPIIRADQFYFQHYSDDRLATYWYGWNKEGYHTSTSNSVPTEEWSHVAVTWDNETGVQFYINGKKDNRISNTGPGDPLGWIKIGQESSNRRFNGKIDQAKVFNRSLSQQEIIEETEDLSSKGAVLDTRFDEEGGDSIYDSSRTKNHGNLQPNETYGPSYSEGFKGNGLEFDGSNYVDISSSDSAYDTRKMAVSAWVKPDSGGWVLGNGARHRLNVDNDAHWWIKDVNGNSHSITGGSISGDQWQYVVGTYNSDTGIQKLFVDGKKVASQSVGTEINSGHDNQIIGGSYGNNANYDGKLDKVKIYPYTPSEAEIKDKYDARISRTSARSIKSKNELVLSQTFDRVEKCGQGDTLSCPSGMSDEIAVDESGEANHGELVNGPIKKITGECKAGKCLGFDGAEDRVYTSDLGINGSEPRAVSAWFNSNEDEVWYNNNQNWATIFDFAESESSHGSFMVAVADSGSCSSEISVHIWGDSICSGKTLSDLGTDNWHHVVALQNSSGYQKIYINGELEGTDSYSINTPSGNFQIGRRHYSSNHYFNGRIDQLRVYNRSLSDQEVWNLYSKGRDRSSEGEVAGPAGRWDFSSEYGEEVYDRAGEGNTGHWNSNGPATEKRYVVNHYHAGRGLSVSAYENDTEINAGSCTKTLNRGDTKTFSAGCYSVADSVESEKPFSAHFQAGGSDGPVPESFAGREFVYEDCRDTDYFNIVSPYNSASVSVKNASGTIMSTTVSQGGHKEINPNIEQGDEYTIESDSKILVSYDRSMGDTYMMHPASDNVWGLIEDLIVSKDNTQVTVYDSDGNTVTDTVYNKYDRIGLSQGGSQGGSESHRAVANKSALGGSRCADADNGELDIAISNNEMSKEFRLPEPVAGAGNNVGDYYVSLTTSDQATCSVYHRNGTLAAEKSSGQSSPYPGFITFDTTYDFNLTEKGARVSCTEPSAMQWEPSDYEGESNLYGVDTRPEGKTGKALDLDGKEDYVDISSATWSNYFGSSANQDTWTTTAWVKVDNLNKGYNDGTAGAIIGQRYGTTTVPLGVREDGSLFVDLDDSRSASPESTGTIEEDKWYHVAASYSWSDDLSSTPYGKAEFYINGKHAGTDTNDNDDGASTSSELYLGKDARYDMHLDGKIDDVRIYPYALNKGQVQQVMNGGGVGVGS